MFFSSTGSITGSMYSSRFSNRKGKPYWMASSSCFRKSEEEKVLTLGGRGRGGEGGGQGLGSGFARQVDVWEGKVLTWVEGKEGGEV